MNVKWLPPYTPVTLFQYPEPETDPMIYSDSRMTRLNKLIRVYCPKCKYSIYTDVPSPMCGQCNNKLITAIFDDMAGLDS